MNTERPRRSVTKPLGSKKAEKGFLATIRFRSRETTNQRLRNHADRSIWASTAELGLDEGYDEDGLKFSSLLYRFLLGLILLPFCWVTTWTLFTKFSQATIDRGFWQTEPFWYFAIGGLLMFGWFWSGIGQRLFLYFYVLGHEMTHGLFVKCCGGKVLEMQWSADGGYVTTDKTNWIIALSPYFVPFWTVVAVFTNMILGWFIETPAIGTMTFYSVVGATWTFHMAWTLWMIPRDQPDLRETGTFLSLVLIYFGNLIVLITLLCMASPTPYKDLQSFIESWLATAATWCDWTIRCVAGLAG